MTNLIHWNTNPHNAGDLTGRADGIAGHFAIGELGGGWFANYVSTELSRNKAKAKTLTRHTKSRRNLKSRNAAADLCERWIKRGDCDESRPEPKHIPGFSASVNEAERQSVLDTIAELHREHGIV